MAASYNEYRLPEALGRRRLGDIAVLLPLTGERHGISVSPIEHVYFITDAIVSVVAKYLENDVEIGIIGCEGMTGSALILGAESSSYATYIQVAGKGQRISSEKFRQCMDQSQTLRPWLLRYVHAFAVQTAHTGVANARARIPERLARWLLMSHDRVPGDELALTHEFLSTMLATRRAGGGPSGDARGGAGDADGAGVAVPLATPAAVSAGLMSVAEDSSAWRSASPHQCGRPVPSSS